MVSRLAHIACGCLAGLILLASPQSAAAQPPTAPHAEPAPLATAVDAMTMDTFLDRLMLAESGGRDTVANPRSTAVGPFQFVVATFLSVTGRHFGAETAALTPAQILALRTNRAFARRVAEAYTRDNAAQLAAAAVTPTWTRLRLAFFAGGDGAVRVIKAAPATPVATVLGQAAVNANPFLARMSTSELVARAARDLNQLPGASIAAAGLEAAPVARKRNEIPVRCDLGLASCRRWLALAESRQLHTLAASRKRRL